MTQLMGQEVAFPAYRVAAVQAAPVFLDRDATVDKACRLIKEVAASGASLAVFPETWIPGYPVWTNADSRWNYRPAKEAYSLLYRNAVDVPGRVVDRLCEAAGAARVAVVMGVHERSATGTLYNSMIFIDRDGRFLGKHRKLVPTYHERMIWGRGDGSTLSVFDTELGRLGGLVCWEHWMPLARYALYATGEQVHAAVWPSATETFLLACRAMAFEGRLYVVVAASYLTRSMLPPAFPLKGEMESFSEELCIGGSAVVGPDGRFLAGPVYGGETIVYADIDLGRLAGEKLLLDVAGHYSRPDVFSLHINRRRQEPLLSDEADMS
ncbi:MAG TPA: carbon-nitrogen hydrolase family protein [Dehalococcoidia bacterium]|nr:carbon-nitrogen hydrolase family protein [Dehalococcoidia bacterium]